MQDRAFFANHRSWTCRPAQTGLRQLLAIVLATTLVGGTGPAEALERQPTPLEAEVSPTSSVIGTTVTISGRSVALGDNNRIAIRINGQDNGLVRPRTHMETIRARLTHAV